MTTVNLVKLGIARLTSSALVEKGRNIVTKMTANPNFPTPNPSLVELADAANELEAANALVLLNGGKQEYESRRVALMVFTDVLRRLAGYVSSVAGGDREMILSSGFEARKRPQPLGQLVAPGNLRAAQSRYPRQVDLTWDGVRGKGIYEVWMTEGDPTLETGWSLVAQTTRNRYTATDLTPLRYYSFRVAAVGTAGSSPMSLSATALAA